MSAVAKSEIFPETETRTIQPILPLDPTVAAYQEYCRLNAAYDQMTLKVNEMAEKKYPSLYQPKSVTVNRELPDGSTRELELWNLTDIDAAIANELIPANKVKLEEAKKELQSQLEQDEIDTTALNAEPLSVSDLELAKAVDAAQEKVLASNATTPQGVLCKLKIAALDLTGISEERVTGAIQNLERIGGVSSNADDVFDRLYQQRLDIWRAHYDLSDEDQEERWKEDYERDQELILKMANIRAHSLKGLYAKLGAVLDDTQFDLQHHKVLNSLLDDFPGEIPKNPEFEARKYNDTRDWWMKVGDSPTFSDEFNSNCTLQISDDANIEVGDLAWVSLTSQDHILVCEVDKIDIQFTHLTVVYSAGTKLDGPQKITIQNNFIRGFKKVIGIYHQHISNDRLAKLAGATTDEQEQLEPIIEPSLTRELRNVLHDMRNPDKKLVTGDACDEFVKFADRIDELIIQKTDPTIELARLFHQLFDTYNLDILPASKAALHFEELCKSYDRLIDTPATSISGFKAQIDAIIKQDTDDPYDNLRTISGHFDNLANEESPDADLISLVDDWWTLERLKLKTDEAGSPRCDALECIYQQISEMPVTTMEGVRAKLSIFVQVNGRIADKDNQELFRSILGEPKTAESPAETTTSAE